MIALPAKSSDLIDRAIVPKKTALLRSITKTYFVLYVLAVTVVVTPSDDAEVVTVTVDETDDDDDDETLPLTVVVIVVFPSGETIVFVSLNSFFPFSSPI